MSTSTDPEPGTTPHPKARAFPANANETTRSAESRAPHKVALAVLLTANFTLAVDFSILNVALPHIGEDLGFATSTLQWIVTSFALGAAGFTLFFGRVGDIVGHKRLFLAGVLLLGISSLAGGLAAGPVLLLVARVGQGLATAMVTPAALALMTTLFSEGPARSRALGLNGALMAAGFTIGAVLGGLLTGAVSWRWAFFINVVVAVAVLLIAPRALPAPPAARRPRLDVPGAVGITLSLVALVLGIDSAGHRGWSHVGTWGPLLGAAVVALVFVSVERRATEPLLDPRLLERRDVRWANAAGLLAFGTFTSLVFLLTLYLQEVLGYSAMAAGLILGVLGIGTVLGGLLAPRIIEGMGTRAAISLGLAVQAAATLPLVFLSTDRDWVLPLLALTFVGGVANLTAIVGYTVAATTGVARERHGLATGLVTLSQQVGIALGTPVMSAIATGVAAPTLLPGLQTAVGVNAAMVAVMAVAAGWRLRTP